MRNFGQLVHVHSPKLFSKALGPVIAAVMSIGCWWAIRVMKPPNPGLAGLIALGFSIVTIVLGVSWWCDRSLRIKVYEHGIGWKRAGTRNELHFDEIAGVSEFQVNGKPAALYLQLHAGGEVTIPANVTDHDALVARIASRVNTAVPPARTIGR